jgi:hypothetical protein
MTLKQEDGCQTSDLLSKLFTQEKQSSAQPKLRMNYAKKGLQTT